MKYKLILINPKGTILNEKNKLSEGTKKALIDIQDKMSIKIALVGYQPLEDLLPIGKELELQKFSGYLISPIEGLLYNCHTTRTNSFESSNIVAFFMDKLDLLEEEIIAIGANIEDAEMIQSAGLGVAMAQAVEPIKAIAQYITLSNDSKGIEHFINKYIRMGNSPLPYTLEEINQSIQNTLVSRLGMAVSIVTENYVEMTMPVDNWTCQPMGILHGGANLALAETAAGLGSMMLIERGTTIQVGIQVSGYHVGRALIGDTMRAEARILHRGKSTHVWSVEVFSQKTNKLIHTARVLNSIIKIR